jgi:hypothetical protein
MLIHAPATPPPDSFTVIVIRSLRQTLLLLAAGLLRGTPLAMLTSWTIFLAMLAPAMGLYVITTLDHNPHWLRWTLSQLPVGVGVVLGVLTWQLRRAKAVKAIILRARDIALVHNDGTQRLVSDGITAIGENERFFTVRLRVHPWGLIVDKRRLSSPAAADILRRLTPRSAPPPPPASPPSLRPRPQQRWLN